MQVNGVRVLNVQVSHYTCGMELTKWQLKTFMIVCNPVLTHKINRHKKPYQKYIHQYYFMKIGYVKNIASYLSHQKVSKNAQIWSWRIKLFAEIVIYLHMVNLPRTTWSVLVVQILIMPKCKQMNITNLIFTK